MDNKQVAERVLDRAANGCVVRSELVDIKLVNGDPKCINLCGHVGVKFEDCWQYTTVSCLVCGKGLGVS